MSFDQQFTYNDPSGDDVSAVRFDLGDTDPDSPIFYDVEIQYLLLKANGDVAPTGRLTLSQIYYAVGLAWKRISGDKAKLAKRQKIAIITKDTVPTFKSCLEMSEQYFTLSLSVGGAGSSYAVEKQRSLTDSLRTPMDPRTYRW